MSIKVTVASSSRLTIRAAHRASVTWNSYAATSDKDAKNILSGLVIATAEKIRHITQSHGIAVILSHNKFDVSSMATSDGIMFKEYLQTSDVLFNTDKDLAFFLLMCDPSTL